MQKQLTAKLVTIKKRILESFIINRRIKKLLEGVHKVSLKLVILIFININNNNNKKQ